MSFPKGSSKQPKQEHENDKWVNKGFNLYSLGHVDEAIKCYDKALEINPQHANSWYHKALAEDKLNLK